MTMNLKTGIIFFIILFYSYCNMSFAQSDYRPGYIIKNSNDTIRGFIDFRGEIINSTQCSFVSKLGDKPTTFLPNDISEYRFNGGKYYITDSIKLGGETKIVFLEFLLRGIVDLYSFKDILGTHFFIDNKKGAFVELTNNDVLSTKWVDTRTGPSKSEYISKTNRYIGVLTYLFSDQISLQKKINKVKLNKTSLISITRDYHNLACNSYDCIVYEKSIPKVKYTFAPVISATNSSLYFSRIKPGFGRSNSFSLGLLVNMKFSGLNDKYSIDFESNISKRDYLNTFLSTSNGGLTNNYNDYTAKQTCISNSLAIKYLYPKRSILPMIYFGISTGYYIKNIVQTLREEISSGVVKTYIVDLKHDNIFFGGVLGAGLQFSVYGKQTFIQAQYNKSFTVETFNLFNHGDNISLKIGVFIN